MSKRNEEIVECTFESGVMVRVPKCIFDQVVLKMNLPNRDYITYSEDAVLYGMSKRRFHDLASDANAKIRYGGKVLVSVKAVNAFLESCKIE